MSTTHVIAINRNPRLRERVAFDIDFATGAIDNVEIEGPEQASSFVRGLQQAQARFSGRIFFPWQQSYPAKPPLNDPQSLAWLLLSRNYRLEGELGRYDAPRPDPTEPGTFN